MKIKSIKIAILGLILLVSHLHSFAQPLRENNGNAQVQLSLNAYSFTKPLLDKVKGRGEGMSLFEFMDWAAAHNFPAVDLTAYFFPGYPNVPEDAFLNEVKRYAFLKGLDISGTGVRNDFANPDPKERAKDVEHVKEWILAAEKLGAPVIRVFSGTIPEGYENKRDEILEYMAASLRECAEFGKEHGVLVGVQNHGDFLKTADQTIELVNKVDSDWFGVIVDTGYFVTEDPYKDIEKVMPYAVNFQLKESVFGAASDIEIDLQRIMGIVKISGYRGYLPIETLSPVGGNKDKSKSRKNLNAAYDPYEVVPAFQEKVVKAKKKAFKI